MHDPSAVAFLGACRIESPLLKFGGHHDTPFAFYNDSDRVLYDVTRSQVENGKKPARGKKTPAGKGGRGRTETPEAFEKAGPRARIFFDPAKVRAGIVTCGGLSPGINNVIRAIVMQLHHHYGVRHILGFRYGYEGFIPSYGHETVELTPDAIKDIHNNGGSILSSSRGSQDVEEIVDCLERNSLKMLFCIGGDGTLRGAHRIAEEVARRDLKISIIGVPKTIDNDIPYCVKTFGFETAFAKAVEAIQAAHVEANGAPYGIVIVKLMGRDSGFIAANTTLACPDVNMVLVPEVPFALEGEQGLLSTLERKMRRQVEDRRHPHAVLAVAEGAGQHLVEATGEHDPSGNLRYGDIGQLLKSRISEHFKGKLPINLKYIEPSYLIRSLPANPSDGIFCFYLADNVVHAAMAGKTDMMVGYWNGHFTHVPLSLVTQAKKRIDPNSNFWRQVIFSTGQPANMI